uniref:Uncharacterized protein n=1 Tax=Meloidogyne floridensis TaxID=298350 RepID=A0A915PEA8_9BILA
MASPIKTTIVNALRALAKIKSKEEWVDNIKEGDSNQVKAIKLDAQFKRLEEEINKAEANIEDIRLSLSSWTDLLRKIPSDERQMANDEYEAFQKTHKLEASMEAVDTMLRQLKDFKDEVSIKAKVAMAKSDKELKEEEMKHSQKMQSTSAQSSGIPQIAATTISSVYQLPTLQIKPFNGNRKDWREVPRRPNRMSFQPMQRSNQFQRRSAPNQNQRQDFTYATLAQGQQIRPNPIKRSSSRRPRVSTNQTMDRQPQMTWKCAFCDEEHFHDKCVKYSTPQERLTRAKEKKLCTRCLRKVHTSFNCPKPSMCFHCKRMHPSALCFVKMQNRYAQRQENVQPSKPGNQNSTNNRQPEQANAVKEEGSKSVLMTLPAIVCNPKRFATHTIYAASVQVNVVITEERPCIACFTNVKENNDWPTKSEWPAAGTCIHSAEEKKISNEEDIIVHSTLDQNKSIEEDNMTINDREANENLATFFGLHSIGMDDTMLPEDKDESNTCSANELSTCKDATGKHTKEASTAKCD